MKGATVTKYTGLTTMLTYNPNKKERGAACAAVDAMIASRPLRPPPLAHAAGAPRSSAAIALAQDIKSGAYVP